MSIDPTARFLVALAGASARDFSALTPAAEVLSAFEIASERCHWDDATLDSGFDRKFCAVIVASPDENRPGKLAENTALPVIRVPVGEEGTPSLPLIWSADGNLPAGTPGTAFATMAVGTAGAKNAALFVIALLSARDPHLLEAWRAYRTRQTEEVLRLPPPVVTN